MRYPDRMARARVQKPKGASPAALALTLVVTVALIAGGLVYYSTHRGDEAAPAEAEAAEREREKVDPFADLPPEEPPPPRDPSLKKVDRSHKFAAESESD